jgi:hypothetical protein
MFRTMIRLVLGPVAIGTVMAAIDMTTTVDPLLKLIESLGVLGVLVWYLWYVTSRDRPRTEAKHAEMIERIISQQNKSLDKAVTDFRSEFQEQRASTAANIQHVMSQMEKANETVLSVVQNCSEVQRSQRKNHGTPVQ